jgi:prevent-host-death family protein
MATTIPQRELRNQAGTVLRRAEQGERFTITVDGRPVAELGPLAGARAPAPPESFAALIRETPVDVGFAADIQAMREEDDAVAVDPWVT